MISEHSAHLTPLSVDFRTWLWRYTCLLLLISMLWHRQVIFKSKGDKLCSSAECRIWTRGPRHQIASSLNARWQTDWAIEDQAKKLELDIHTYMFVVVNFDALAQANDIWIERIQVVFLCWRQDSNPSGSQTPNRQQTEARWQTDWAIEDQAKTWTRQPVPMISEYWAHSTPQPFGIRTWLWRNTCLLL